MTPARLATISTIAGTPLAGCGGGGSAPTGGVRWPRALAGKGCPAVLPLAANPPGRASRAAVDFERHGSTHYRGHVIDTEPKVLATTPGSRYSGQGAACRAAPMFLGERWW